MSFATDPSSRRTRRSYSSPKSSSMSMSLSTMTMSLSSLSSAASGERRKRQSYSLDSQGSNEQLKVAHECIDAGYDLVWNKQDYDQAVQLLQKALQIQQSYLGKHHKDVGMTCNFIGTAFWLKREHRMAMRYFLEARRIFCKSGGGRVKGVDLRIRCIFNQLGIEPEEIAKYQTAIQQTIEYELQGDRLKQLGFADRAKDEYQKARRASASLHAVM